jgi:hypothetical protein
MKNVKALKVTGFFDVSGVVNFNGVESRNGNKNHRAAKKTSEGVDYTSSNCLRQAMFQELIPRQPGSEENKEQYPTFMGTVAGILRGGMDASSGCKGKSPFTLTDAESTINCIVFEQNTSSKPKEKDLKSNKGADASDTSMFSKDNAGTRKQKLNCILRISDLQFREIGDDSAIVKKDKEEEYIKSLKMTMESLDVDTSIEVKTAKLSTQLMPSNRQGVIFNDDQLRGLVKSFIALLANIEVFRRDAKLSVDLPSLLITIIFEDMSTLDVSLDNFSSLVPELNFQKFYVGV